MENLKKNLPLYVGLAIPFLLVAVIAMLIYVPRVLSGEKPQYDFVYAVGENVVYASSYPGYLDMAKNPAGTYPNREGVLPKYRYQIIGGKITRIENPAPAKEYAAFPVIDVVPKFYLHHVADNRSEEITFEQLSQLSLESTTMSPDGYAIEQGRSNGSPFFGGSYDYRKKYLRKDTFAEEMNLSLPQDYYYQEFLLGWVKK